MGDSYTEADVQLVARAIGGASAATAAHWQAFLIEARAVLDVLSSAGRLRSLGERDRGRCGNRGSTFLVGGQPYVCELLAGHEGMHEAANPDGVTRCQWWSCTCPDVTRFGALAPEVMAGGNPNCPVHGEANPNEPQPEPGPWLSACSCGHPLALHTSRQGGVCLGTDRRCDCATFRDREQPSEPGGKPLPEEG